MTTNRLLSAALTLAVTVCIASAQTYTITTFAGGGLPLNTPGTSTSLYQPQGVAVDSKGNLFFTNQNSVLRLDATTGLVTVAAGNGTVGFSGDNGLAINAQLYLPQGVAVDAAGNLFIADTRNSRIRKVTNGVITTIAGGGSTAVGYSGPAASARLFSPAALAVDSGGDLYIAEPGSASVREISSGVITTVAGNGRSGYGGDGGPATSAELNNPSGVAIDSDGNLYIADNYNHRVRKVANGVITTAVGTGIPGGPPSGGDNGPATGATLIFPAAVTIDSGGNLYIADSGNGTIRKVANGVITSVVEGPGGGGGTATIALLNNPMGVAVDSAGYLFIADSLNNQILKVAGRLLISIAAGTRSAAGDGGPATSAPLSLGNSGGAAVDSAGNAYILEPGNNRIRKVSGGVITTVAGNGTGGFSGDNGPATSAQLSTPQGVAVDSAGNIYIADTFNNCIRKVSGGVITTVAGNGTTGFSGDGGPATSAQLYNPFGVAVDSAGNIYIADTANNRIREVSNGVISTVAGSGPSAANGGFGGDGGPSTSALLNNPYGIAVDSAGNLYISDTYNSRVREVSKGVISTVAGNGALGFSGDNGAPTSAQLGEPVGAAVDSAGNLYIASAGRVRKVANGVISTIAGGGTSFGDNGPATSAQVPVLNSVAVDSAGNVYIADSFNNRIRLLTPGTTPSITPNGIVPVYSSIPIIQPGSWVSIYGTNLASTTTIWNNDFPTSLGGTSVTIDNKPAYLWVVSPTQINLQVPDDSTTGPVSVVVTTTSGTTTSTVTLAPQAPSFSLLGDNKHVAAEIATPSGTGAYANGTYDLLGPANTFSFFTRPVKAGETLTLYGVGFGPTNPAVPAGKVFSGSAPPTTPVTVTIGGLAAPVSYSGITQAGLYQINLTVPAAPSGDQPLTATINGVQTPPGPVVAVQ